MRVAASTRDQRVCGKSRGASLEEGGVLMRGSYTDELPETSLVLHGKMNTNVRKGNGDLNHEWRD